MAGERDPNRPPRHCQGRVKAGTDDIVRALTGNRRHQHLFVLGQAPATYDDLERRMAECDVELRTLMAQWH